jgi:hypothetical protein
MKYISRATWGFVQYLHKTGDLGKFPCSTIHSLSSCYGHNTTQYKTSKILLRTTLQNLG